MTFQTFCVMLSPTGWVTNLKCQHKVMYSIVIRKFFIGAQENLSNFTKWHHLTHEIFRILSVFSRFLWIITFIFSGSHEKLSLVSLEITSFVYSPWKVLKRWLKAKLTKNQSFVILYSLGVILVQGFFPLKI